MAYFAVLLARAADKWQASEVELDELEDLTGTADLMRRHSADDAVLLLLEQEDAWFAVMRVDGEEDPRVFVSDRAAAARSAYGELLTSGGLTPLGPDGEPADDVPAAAGETDDEEDDSDDAAFDDDEFEEFEDDFDEEGVQTPAGPAGDGEILADFGIEPADLAEIAEENVTGQAVTDLAERIGAADELEALR